MTASDGRRPTVKLRIAIFGAALLTLLASSPAHGKNRPTVDADNGDTCFGDAETDKNCNAGGSAVGAICYCCYDDGCWICGADPLPGNECVWDPAYRAIGTVFGDGPMSTEDPHHLTEGALIALLEKKNVVTKKDLVDEVMTVRKRRARGALENGRLEQSVATQKKINRYFHDVVVPKLKTCWSRIQGSGTIAMKYSYKNAKDRWAFETVKVGKSDLPKGQDEVALDCMQKAVAATSFPKETGDTSASYSINWSWPVPFPPDAGQQAEAMFRSNGGTGGGGCDGHGAAASCVACSGYPVSCVAVCVGGNPPCEMTENPLPGGFRRTCKVGTGCASGGAFGVVGGAVMY
jgi:hypothetical protein